MFRGYKTFFRAQHRPANKSEIINYCKLLAEIAEHINWSANKYENANYCWHFHIH